MGVITGYIIRNESRNDNRNIISITVFKVTADFGLWTVVKEMKNETETKRDELKHQKN